MFYRRQYLITPIEIENKFLQQNKVTGSNLIKFNLLQGVKSILMRN